jgi:tetratricopeptide (TPR) repeat protein
MPAESRIDELKRRVHADPASIAFAQLAEEYRRAGQLTEAVETCRAGLALRPEFLSVRVTLARALLALGELDQASTELTDVIAASPVGNLAATRALADTRRRQGRLDEALDQYRVALSLAPNDPDLERTVAEITDTLAAAATRAAESRRARAAAVVAALERWLEGLRAARTNRLS